MLRRLNLSAVGIIVLLAVTLWGGVVMLRNSLAVLDRERMAGETSPAQPGGMAAMAGMAGRIAFSQSGRIAVAMGDGSMPTFLTRGPGDQAPLWSPDGSRLAFVRAGTGAESGLLIIDADATDLHRLAPAAALYSRASWSPDSRRLVFRDSAKDRAGIYTAAVDGTELTQIFQGNANTPVWSPDGRWIAFTFNESPTTGGLYVMDPDGGALTILLPGVFSEVAWSPDSKRLAVRGVPWAAGRAVPVQGVQTVEQVLVVDRSSGKSAPLTMDAGGGTWAPAWSPDGQWIAFVAGREGAQQLSIAPAAGGPAQSLGQGTSITSFVWSPDGSELAVAMVGEDTPEPVVALMHTDGSVMQPYAWGEFPSWAR